MTDKIYQEEEFPDEETVEGEFIEAAVEETVLIPPSQSLATIAPPRSDGMPEFMSEIVHQKRGNRLAIFPLGMGFIGLGVLLLAENRVEGLTISTTAAGVILLGALILSYIFRFFTSGRRERGLFFLAVVFITWGALLALSIIDNETFPLDEFWPLTLTGIGIAFFITFLFERSHQVGLVFPGFVLIFASGVSFAVSLDVIDNEILDTVADYWPLALAFVGLTLLPTALQEH